MTNRLLATVAFLAFLIVPASGQGKCSPRAEMVAKLETKYHETLRHIALTSKGGALEIYVSERGTWTLLVSSPGGVSCVVEVGKDFMSEPAEIPGSDS